MWVELLSEVGQRVALRREGHLVCAMPKFAAPRFMSLTKRPWLVPLPSGCRLKAPAPSAYTHTQPTQLQLAHSHNRHRARSTLNTDAQDRDQIPSDSHTIASRHCRTASISQPHSINQSASHHHSVRLHVPEVLGKSSCRIIARRQHQPAQGIVHTDLVIALELGTCTAHTAHQCSQNQPEGQYT